MDLSGRSAIVSGGASGLGSGAVRQLVSAGARCTIFDLNEAGAAELAKELGDQVTVFVGDVTKPDDVRRAVEHAAAQADLRVAVSCAGIARGMRTLNRQGEPHDPETFDLVMRVNVYGTFNLLTIASSAMSKNDPLTDDVRGVVINTASVAAFEGQIGQLAYSASKGAIVGMTVPAARDLSVVGIRVLAIAPGVFETPLLVGLLGDARAELGATVLFPKRLGTPEDFGRLVRHVAENDYLNGEVIRLDAGVRLAPK